MGFLQSSLGFLCPGVECSTHGFGNEAQVCCLLGWKCWFFLCSFLSKGVVQKGDRHVSLAAQQGCGHSSFSMGLWFFSHIYGVFEVLDCVCTQLSFF